MPTKNVTIHEPPPAGNGQVVFTRVFDDLKARTLAGAEQYGTLLRTNNGRDALLDAYQEAIDAVFYLAQAIMEREEAAAKKGQM